MRKTSYIAVALLVTGFSAQAADMFGSAPVLSGGGGKAMAADGLSAPGAQTPVVGATPAVSVPRVNVDANTGVNAAGSVNSRDATTDVGIPISPPLQSAAPIVDTSATTTTSGTGSSSPTGTSAPTTTVRGTAGATATSNTTTTSTGTSAGAEPEIKRLDLKDRNGQTITPADQANTRANLYVTGAIRQSLVKNGLGAAARNIKINTTNGLVTLTGSVRTEAEKARIESLARASAGAVTLDSQLNVKAKP